MLDKWLDPALLLLTALTPLAGAIAHVARQPWASIGWAAGNLVMAGVLLVEIPLRRQARKNILQIRIRIMAIEPSRLDQSHDRHRPFAAA